MRSTECRSHYCIKYTCWPHHGYLLSPCKLHIDSCCDHNEIFGNSIWVKQSGCVACTKRWVLTDWPRTTVWKDLSDKRLLQRIQSIRFTCLHTSCLSRLLRFIGIDLVCKIFFSEVWLEMYTSFISKWVVVNFLWIKKSLFGRDASLRFLPPEVHVGCFHPCLAVCE